MKKIFIPVITLVAISFAAPSYSRWGETFKDYNASSGALFSSDSDGYWLNKFRGYKKYPIVFYSEKMLQSKDAGSTDTFKTREYKHNVIVSAKKGQRMYDLTTYNVTKNRGKEQYKVTDDGYFYSGQNEIKLWRDDLLEPLGEVKINGNYYIILQLPDTSYVVMADSKGIMLDALGQIEHDNLLVSKEITIVHPKDLGVVPYREEIEEKGSNKTAFEISYEGMYNGNIVLKLTEDEKNDAAQLQYLSPDDKIVNIHGVRFEITHVTPEYIEYRILD